MAIRSEQWSSVESVPALKNFVSTGVKKQFLGRYYTDMVDYSYFINSRIHCRSLNQVKILITKCKSEAIPKAMIPQQNA